MERNKSYSSGPFRLTDYPEGDIVLEFNRYVLQEFLNISPNVINFSITLKEMK